MVLSLNLISLISRKALVPFEFDVHLRAAPHKAGKEFDIKKRHEKSLFNNEMSEGCKVDNEFVCVFYLPTFQEIKIVSILSTILPSSMIWVNPW